MTNEPQRRAFVTGASSGIGEAFARRLALEGWDLVLVARRGEVLERLAAELRDRHPTRVEVLVADLAADADVARVEQALRDDVRLELLVNNAGFGTQGRFHDLPAEPEVRMARLHVEAVLRLTHAALPGMVARGRGAVVNVSSGLGFVPAPYYATYGATKAFVNSFSEALAEELRGSGVSVQVLCPGFTRTEFQRRAGMDASRIPDFLWQSPEDVVAESLAALQRGTVVCVPGRLNRASMGPVRGGLSRAATRRILAAFGRRQLD
jgi:short-subunit dehydrogenase